MRLTLRVRGLPRGIHLAGRGLVDGMKALKETGDWNRVKDKMVDDEEFFDIVGLHGYKELYDRYDIS